MAFQPILNPELPYVGEIEGGLTPGKMVKVQGNVPADATRFAINYQLGPNLNPRDDIAIHISPRFAEGFITRNSIESFAWGKEENDGPMWIKPGSPFEIIILCEHYCYKIAVNGRHFTEFAHRLPYASVTHLVIDGEVEISSIFYEVIPIGIRPSAPVPDVPPVDVGPPGPGGIYPTLHPQEKYDPQQDEFRNNPPRAYGYHEREKAEEENQFSGCLDKLGLAAGGLAVAGGIAAALHAHNKNKKKHAEEEDHEKTSAKENESGLGSLGALGAALASSLASDGNSRAGHGYPPESDGLGSILGTLASLGGLSGTPQQGQQQQPSANPLGGTLGSILGGVLSGGGQQQQPQYQPSGGYGGPAQNQGGQGGGNDLLSGLGSVLLKSAMDGLTKHSQGSSNHGNENSAGYYPSPAAPPPTSYGRPDYEAPQYQPPKPPAPAGGKLSAAEISKGLGFDDDED